jgi:hypothetical protein
VPNPSDVSQSGRRLLSAPGLNPAKALTSERSTATALSNLQIESGRSLRQSPEGNPSSPGAGRKRRAKDVGRERRLRARSSGTLPQHPSAYIPRGDPNSPLRHSSLRRGSDPSATHAPIDPASEPTDVERPGPTAGNHIEHFETKPDAPNTKTQPPAIKHEQHPNIHQEQDPPPSASDIQEPTYPEDDTESLEEPELLLQPETKPISQSQLIVEVRGIYAGLVLVEAKCIDVDARQIALAQEKDSAKLTPEQWRALIALHKTLLHEHHDFFLASQHPAATPQLSKLAEKYAMPSRMWRHAIHGFLEVLRHRLPDSLEYMLAFVYIAYSMIALLHETVPTFETTWIECLGDLARYRMSIDDDMQDRDAWGGVARFWYAKALERIPKVCYATIGVWISLTLH